jgi:hypothetical protein
MDLTTEPQLEKLFRLPLLRPYLSMQSCLGYYGEAQDRTVSAKIAWATLNLRQTALSFAFTFNSPKPGTAPGTHADITKPGKM